SRDALELIGDLLGEELVCDDPGVAGTRQGLEPLHRLLNHGTLAIERQHLLGAGAAGAGPKPCSAAAGKNHGTEINTLCHERHILRDEHTPWVVTAVTAVTHPSVLSLCGDPALWIRPGG